MTLSENMSLADQNKMRSHCIVAGPKFNDWCLYEERFGQRGDSQGKKAAT